MTRLQRTIARRMAAAKATIPEFVTDVEIDMEAVAAVRRELKEAGRPAPSFNAFVVKACATALRAVPQVNASCDGDELVLHRQVNVGVAVAKPQGLIVPTVFDADRLSVEQIGDAVAGLAAKVRDGSIVPAELAGGTFTVSNLGMHRVQRFTAIVNPPQAAILAAGAVEQRIVAHDGRPEARLRMTASLTADHRVVYGADAAEFLDAVRGALEAPEPPSAT